MPTKQQEIAKNFLDNDQVIPPAPHYPNWVFLCPKCLHFWETQLYHFDFRVTCPECAEE